MIMICNFKIITTNFCKRNSIINKGKAISKDIHSLKGKIKGIDNKH